MVFMTATIVLFQFAIVPEWTSDKPYPHYIPNPYLPFSAQDPEALMYTLDEEGLAVLAEHKHIDYRKDLLDFVRSLPAAFKQSYQIVDRVGEGSVSCFISTNFS